jgi:hypothetical protein
MPRYWRRVSTARTDPLLVATIVRGLSASLYEECLDYKTFPHRLHI